MTTNPLSVILVDDHCMYREGVRSVISKLTCCPVKVIGEAGSGAEFFRLLDAGSIPYLVLLDIMLPDMSGVEIARRLKSKYPDTKIIMLSSEVSEALITELIEIGVDGYLSKLARREDIEVAICTVTDGNQYFGRSVAKMMYDIYLARQHTPTQQKSRHTCASKYSKPDDDLEPLLSEREKEVIRLLCDGLQIKEVADKLNISTRTVESYKNKILIKLGFTRMSDLIKYAIKEGLIVL